jgi:thiosulfate dehydrogenase [quinone] small subunit
MKPVKNNETKKENKYWQTTTGKILVVTLVFAIIVVSFTLITGQIAYGNVVGKLFNDSKTPDVQFYSGHNYTSMPGYSNGMFTMNVTDLNGPNQAAITEIVFHNTATGKNITVNATTMYMYKSDISIYNPPKRDYHTDISVQSYGIHVPLGGMAIIHMNLEKMGITLKPGTYSVSLVVPNQVTHFKSESMTVS